MGDQKPEQKAPIEKTPDKSVDAVKIAGDLGRKELELKQNIETSSAEKSYQKDKSALRADLDAKKADLLASTAPAVLDQSQAPMTDAEKAELDRIRSQAVEAAPVAPVPSPEKPNDGAGGAPPVSPTQGAEGAPNLPAPAQPATPEKGFGDKIKEFFATFFEKIKDFFAKLFGKKEEQKPVETPQANPDNSASPTNPEPASPPSNPEVLKGPDSTAGLKGNALFNNPQFQARTDQIAANIGVSRADLYAIFKMESGGDPQIQNSIGATGLIQWLRNTAPLFGTTTDKLKQMTGLQQLDYVEKFYKPYFGRLHSFSDLYRAVFWPAAIGKGPDYIFQTSKLSAQAVASANPSITRDANGFITNASFERHCARFRPSNSAVPLAVS